MLLHRIRLKGFLGHRGLLNGNGGDEWVEVDFRSSSLWLVHGQNGSGKSSLWDALSFAFFKEPRGGGNEFGQLIHDRCDKADVEIEFELQGQLFRICGQIGKKNSRGRQNDKGNVQVSNTKRIIQRYEDPEWVTVAEGEIKVKEWIKQNFPASSNTFHSAVVLQQGRADRFLLAEPKERRDILTQLLQLGFYKKLDEVAARSRAKAKDKYEEKQEEFSRSPFPTEEQLAEQQNLIGQLGLETDELEAKLKAKEEELQHARNAEKLKAEIEARQKRQQADSELFAQAEQIRAQVRRLRQLRDGVRLLGDLWDARHGLAREEQEWQKHQQQIDRLTSQFREAEQGVENHRGAEAEAAEQLAEAGKRLEQRKQEQAETTQRLRYLTQIEDIERSIRSEELKLAGHLPLLQMRAVIQRSYERYQELLSAIALLKKLGQAEAGLRGAQARVAQTESAVRLTERELQAAAAEKERLRLLVEESSAEIEKLRRDIADYDKQISLLDDRLKRRSDIGDADECPTCGSLLDVPDVRKRLRHEQTHWQEERARIEAEKQLLRVKLIEAETEDHLLQQEIERQSEIIKQLSLRLERARSDYDHSQKDVARSGLELGKAREEAGNLAEQLGRLSQFEKECAELSGTPAEKERLSHASKVEDKVNAVVETLRGQLGQLPEYDPEKRQQIRAEAEDVAGKFATCERAYHDAQAHLDQNRQSVRQVEKLANELNGNLQAMRTQGETLISRLTHARQKVIRVREGLPDEWAGHLACENEVELQSLQQELETLRLAESQESLLGEAMDRKLLLEGEIKAFSEQLGAVPPNHRRPVIEVEGERDALTASRKQAASLLDGARGLLRELTAQNLEAEAKLRQRDDAEREFTRYEKLAKALGRSGLLAVVVQRALERIKINANQTLGRLSAGRWQVDLRAVSETELEILALDLDTQTRRYFENLSGGERFRVAISIAIGIGQSALGDRAVDTLVIDEGFGALDNNNRSLMIQELHRLSTEALQRGRIIVVSHQDDVCESFPNRYRLERNPEGYVKVERTPG
jgi:DNA repair exonuclease SbcCD ATPase subunit